MKNRCRHLCISNQFITVLYLPVRFVKNQPPEMRNRTSVTEFILLGLTDDSKIQAVIFFFLFLTYGLSVAGNLTIIILTLLDSHLKTPMCFFLRNFSFLEISFTSVYNPRFLMSILTGDNLFPIMLVQLSSFSLSFLVQQSSFSWHPCPMIITWLSANLCII